MLFYSKTFEWLSWKIEFKLPLWQLTRSWQSSSSRWVTSHIWECVDIIKSKSKVRVKEFHAATSTKPISSKGVGLSLVRSRPPCHWKNTSRIIGLYSADILQLIYQCSNVRISFSFWTLIRIKNRKINILKRNIIWKQYANVTNVSLYKIFQNIFFYNQCNN